MKIAMLLSGGVDSAVALVRLLHEGHEVTPFYIRIGMDNDEGDCSAEEDIEMCTLICRKYGLKLQIVSLHQEYWDHVMTYALDTVKAGRTPHPDMMCNSLIKFGFFEERWGKDFDFTATGHYADIIETDGCRFLATVPDPVKDQTDFLALLTYQQLSHVIFPLGGLTKSEVRRIAQEEGLPNARRKDSQGICFLGKIDYADFIERHLGSRPGPLIEIETGRKIGIHRGYWFYTIGQRKGLGMSGGPWYVVRKNIRDNVVYVSNGYDTRLQYGRSIDLDEFHWITLDYLAGKESAGISFKTRHTPHFSNGTLVANPDGTLRIESCEDIQGIAPGQYAIVYTPDQRICLGAGMIVASKTLTKKKESHHAE